MTQPQESPVAAKISQTNLVNPDSVSDIRRLSARQHRALVELSTRDLTVAEVRRVAGCSNASDLVSQLRERGFSITSIPIEVSDRDGKPCRTVLYRMSQFDRQRLARGAVS